MDVLKVSTRSNPNSVAGALAGVIRQKGTAEMQVIGAGALNQAVKAIAIARSYVSPSGLDLVCVPSFADVEIGGEERTAIRLRVEDRSHRRLPVVDGELAPRGSAESISVEPIHVEIDLRSPATETKEPEPTS